MGDSCVAPLILILGARRRGGVSHTPWWKRPWYALYRRLGGPQIRFRRRYLISDFWIYCPRLWLGMESENTKLFEFY
jgi:hypothetical protein